MGKSKFLSVQPSPPAAIAAKKQIPISNVLFPTFSEIAGATYKNYDGLSFKSVIKDNDHLERDTLYWHFPHYHSSGEGPSGAIRQGDYKLIEWYDPQFSDKAKSLELYNLSEDPSETTDLSEQMPDKVSQLANKLDAWRQSIGAQPLQ